MNKAQELIKKVAEGQDAKMLLSEGTSSYSRFIAAKFAELKRSGVLDDMGKIADQYIEFGVTGPPSSDRDRAKEIMRFYDTLDNLASYVQEASELGKLIL